MGSFCRIFLLGGYICSPKNANQTIVMAHPRPSPMEPPPPRQTGYDVFSISSYHQCDEHLIDNRFKIASDIHSENINWVTSPANRFFKRGFEEKGKRPCHNILHNYMCKKKIESNNVAADWNVYTFGFQDLFGNSQSEKTNLQKLLQTIASHHDSSLPTSDTHVLIPNDDSKSGHLWDHFQGQVSYTDKEHNILINYYRVLSKANNQSLIICTSVALGQYNFQMVLTNIEDIIVEQKEKESFMQTKFQGFWMNLPLCSFHFDKNDDFWFHCFEFGKMNEPSHFVSDIFLSNHAYYFPLTIARALDHDPLSEGESKSEYKLQSPPRAFSQGVNVSCVFKDNNFFCHVFGLANHLFFYRNHLYCQKIQQYLSSPKTLRGFSVNTYNFIGENHDMKIVPCYKFENSLLLDDSGYCFSDMCSTYFSKYLQTDFTEVGDDGDSTLQSLVKNLDSGNPLQIIPDFRSVLAALHANKPATENSTRQKEIQEGFIGKWISVFKATGSKPSQDNNVVKEIFNFLVTRKCLPQTPFHKNRLSDLMVYSLEKAADGEDSNGFLVIVKTPLFSPNPTSRTSCKTLFPVPLGKLTSDKLKYTYRRQYHPAAEYAPFLDLANNSFDVKWTMKIFCLPSLEKLRNNFLSISTFPSISVEPRIYYNGSIGVNSQYNFFMSMGENQKVDTKFLHFSGKLSVSNVQLLPSKLIQAKTTYNPRGSMKCVGDFEIQLLDEMRLNYGYTMYRVLCRGPEGSGSTYVTFYICSNWFNPKWKDLKSGTSIHLNPKKIHRSKLRFSP